MWFLAMMMAIGAVGASFVRLRRVRGALSFDLSELTRALGRSADVERVRAMREAMRGETETWESELVDVALDTQDSHQRAALINEVLGDVDAALHWGSRVPLVSARLSALGPLCLVFFSLATESAGMAEIVPVLAWAGAGVVGALAVGREAARVAIEGRKSVDVWVGRVLDAAAAKGDARGSENESG
jgi:hypothetical protein